MSQQNHQFTSPVVHERAPQLQAVNNTGEGDFYDPSAPPSAILPAVSSVESTSQHTGNERLITVATATGDQVLRETVLVGGKQQSSGQNAGMN